MFRPFAYRKVVYLSILECENLARQMVEHNISPISYTLKFAKHQKMRESAGEVLRNVQLLQQKKIIICSPRDEKYNLIQLVLAEVRLPT